ncbi:tRNA (N6-isopentenyl adenosine(37)-C2)-methylthiotransferase MiaB [Proteinivorax hydrogeniformans]|uniref:tRNA-2-methylthio-N(6)-dimethylallyladenosine synthase n=1 Tax=Proteinivorax hydrogeniformans TaxID=1826727 RepID=A0AAU8HX66_9FIRM
MDTKQEKNEKLYKILTYGCQMNVHDSEILAGMLNQMGYGEAAVEEDADIILINTCSIRDKAEQKVFGKVGALKKLKAIKNDLVIGICGCMIQQQKVAERLQKDFPHVDLLFGTHNIHQLPQMIEKVLFKDERVLEVWNEEGEVVEGLPRLRDDGVTAWVTITYGCNNFCTYCIVPHVRGRERSRNPQDIVKEIEGIVAKGYKEITLLGQNVNSYGKDFDEDYDFADLLSEVAKIKELTRIRYMTPHPRDFTEKLIDVVAANDKICNHFHLPVQSGSSKVLKAMNRGYDQQTYLDLVGKIKEKVNDYSITTDIIVGFPGETEEDFLETLKVVEQVRYDSAFTFAYSPREGTPAAKMDTQIPQQQKSDRLQRLIEAQNKISRQINDTYVGQVWDVLVEGTSKNDPNSISGRTKTAKIVNFNGDKDLIGQEVKVKITGSQTWSLTGEIID